ncbi:hypothetical protein WA845_03015 [Agrobacterium sp. CMT1]|uniref:hypothetical protein n=1 Tax=Agrobacterium sp. CMT1 TaxID=3128901 RepID=UPI0030784A44
MKKIRTPEEQAILDAHAREALARSQEEKERLLLLTAEFITPTHQRAKVLKALSVNSPLIQNWQYRGQIALDADKVRDGTAWRLYSSRDVLMLGLAVRLVEYGFPASLLRKVMDQVRQIFTFPSPYVTSNRPAFIVVRSNGDVIGPELGTQVDVNAIPDGSFIVVKIDRLVREALEPLGISVAAGNAASINEVASRLSKASG